MLGWNFYINDTQVNEPIGWDGIEFTLRRSQNYTGLENVFTGKDLTFDGIGARLIKDEFELNGPDGTLEFKIEDLCHNKLEATTKWLINLMFFSNTDGLVTVNASETGFSQKFKNRLDTVVSLDSLTSIGGTPLLPPPYKEIGLHSKAIVRQGIMDFEKLPKTNVIQLTDFFDNPEYYFPPLFDRVVTDSDNFTLPYVESVHATNAEIPSLTSNPYFISPNGGRYTFQLKLDVNVITTHHQVTRLRFSIGTGLFDGQKRINNIVASNSSSGTVNFSFAVDQTFGNITMLPGEALWIYLDTIWTGVVGNTSLTYTTTYQNTGNYLKFEDLNQFAAPSTTRALLIHDVFSRMCEILTDEIGSFKSEFFGLTNQFPFYAEDGCGSHVAITNGKNIRKMIQKDGTPFPVSMSFADLYKSCDAIWNIGLRIEYNSFGKGIIRIEPKSFFFRSDSVGLILEKVAGVTIKPATNYIFKSVRIGFEKWNLNQGSINGIDEFNTVHGYSLPLTNAKNSLELLSKFIGSGYIIELTRRIQYDSNPTTDFETDDDNFFICLNDKPVKSTFYDPNGVEKTYKANTVSERNENFPIIQNLISPESAYNIRLSPAHSMLRWWNFISASIYFKIKQDHFTKIKFEYGEGNTQMISTQTGDCKETTLPLKESQHIMENSLDNAETLFIPVTFSFEYPTVFSRFGKVRKNSNLGIQFSCNENARVGFIEELTYLPAGGGNGIGSFTVLVAAGNGAAFDDGFNDGFDT
jgi:hypothetical protein